MPRPIVADKKRHMATLISRAIVMALSVLTLGILFHTYQVSSRLITQEVIRTTNQTANLIQNIFNSRLTILKIHQDSSAKNATLVHALHGHLTNELEQYFLSVDRSDISHMADFRFIANVTQPIWDDGNAQFYGLTDNTFIHIIEQVAFSHDWHLITTRSLIGDVYLLVRRTPIIDTVSGESLGFLYISVVLNNNVTLVENLRERSDSQQLVLAAGGDVLASTLTGIDAYQADEVVKEGEEGYDIHGKYVVSRTLLTLAGAPTVLTVYAVQSNQNALSLRNNYLFWMFAVVAAIAVVFIIVRWWLQRKIENEMTRLMSYTHQVVELREGAYFPGSQIIEFDHFGRTLESTFHQLAEQEKQFEDLFNFSLSPTLLWTAQGGLIRMNPSAEAYFLSHYSQQHSLFARVKPQLIIAVQQAAQGNIVKALKTELDGKTILWELSPIILDERIVSIITQGQDITSMVEAEQQSRLAREQAEESARLRADFLAKMSHELRTPLNGILGASQLLKQNSLTQEQQELVNVLCSSGEHLLAVLNDILDFSKIEQGKFLIQNSDFPIVAVVSAIQRIYNPLCKEKGLELMIECAIELEIRLHSDQIRLNQILFNLLSNAVKFTHQGSICIKLALIQQDGIDKLMISIEDTGIGIAATDLQRIFDPFVQAESTTTREYGGSGLGLSIVSSLVELLHGEITVKSAVGYGTRFDLQFPIRIVVNENLRDVEQTNTDRYQLFTQPVRALLVEDNRTNAFILQAFCQKYSIQVDWVSDGLQAIERVKEQDYDLIFMDNQLPYLGGIDTARIIRHEMKLSLPIYACTADGLLETQQAFIEAGAEYVLVKPLKEEMFYQALCFFKQQRANSER